MLNKLLCLMLLVVVAQAADDKLPGIVYKFARDNRRCKDRYDLGGNVKSL